MKFEGVVANVVLIKCGIALLHSDMFNPYSPDFLSCIQDIIRDK